MSFFGYSSVQQYNQQLAPATAPLDESYARKCSSWQVYLETGECDTMWPPTRAEIAGPLGTAEELASALRAALDPAVMALDAVAAALDAPSDLLDYNASGRLSTRSWRPLPADLSAAPIPPQYGRILLLRVRSLDPNPAAPSEADIRLVFAAENGDGMTAAFIDGLGSVDVNARVDSNSGPGSTALSAACMQGHDRNVRALVAHPCIDVNRRTRMGTVPLVDAVFISEACVAALLEHPRIDVDRLTVPMGDPSNEHGSSALLEAAMYGHANIVEMLLNKGAICDAPARLQGTEDPDDPCCNAGLGALELARKFGKRGRHPFHGSLHLRSPPAIDYERCIRLLEAAQRASASGGMFGVGRWVGSSYITD